MLLHLGGDTSIFKTSISGIFDLEKTNTAATREFLQIARDNKKITQVVKKEQAKSFVLAGDKIYLSPISSVTLQKRFLENTHQMFN